MNEPPLLPPNEPPLLPPPVPPVPPPTEPDGDNEGSILAGVGYWVAILVATFTLLSTSTIFLALPLVAIVAGIVWVVRNGWNRTATGATIAVLLTLGLVLLMWSICGNFHYQG